MYISWWINIVLRYQIEVNISNVFTYLTFLEKTETDLDVKEFPQS